jgi:class 3 adenylate cyclase
MDNPADAVFCGHCGARIIREQICPSCSKTNPADVKFCHSCGSPLAAPPADLYKSPPPQNTYRPQPAAPRTPNATTAPAPSQPAAGSMSLSASGVTPAPSQPPAGGPTSFAAQRYQVKSFLGEGGRKRVYLAADTRLNRDVAIAIIKTEGLDEASMQRLRREAQAMGALGDHPHIVTIHDIGDEFGQPYIVSQYMEGGSIAEVLARVTGHRLPIPDAVRIVGQVCQALMYTHERGVIHRDLKPANVWLTADGTAKLGDFGLAVALGHSRLTTEGMMIGTVAYMPPEQATGREPDARSDLYSLGVMLYEMVAGMPPFVGDDAVSIISQHINTPPVTPSWHNPEIPRPLESLIMQLLAKPPDERPPSAAAVLERLQHVMSAPAETREPVSQSAVSQAIPRLAWGPFVGRRQELADLKATVDTILGGQGSMSMLTGGPGVGKTRLAEEACVYAQLRGAQMLVGRCYEGEGAPPFWPWVQVIRTYVHDRDPNTLMSLMGTGAAEIAQVVSEIRDRLPGLPATPSADPDQARFRLFDSVTNFICNAAKAQPLVIVLDDLQWADKGSLLLLRFLARELRGARVLVIGTYQDMQLHRRHPLQEMLAELWRESPFERIHLDGLTPDEVVDFLESIAQHELDSEGRFFARVLHQETEGNPFFIQEVIRHLVETGHIYHENGRWISNAASLDDLGIAEGVREVVGRRLSRLSDETNSVLTVASVIGRDFDTDVLQAVAELTDDQLMDAIEEASSARIVTETPGATGRYSFSQALIRYTLSDELTTIRRSRLHQRIGHEYEQLREGNLEPHLGQLAYHFLESGAQADVAKGIDYAARAGARALDQLAYEEAAGHFGRAIAALDKLGSGNNAQRSDLLLTLGDAQWRSGDVDGAKDTFLVAAELARRLPAPEKLARAALGFGTGLGGLGLFSKADETLLELLTEALDAVGEEDSALRARLLSRLAVELYLTDQVARRAELSQLAVEVAQRLGDRAVQLVTLYSRHEAMLGPDGLDERLEVLGDLLRLANEIGDREMAFQGHRLQLVARLDGGDVSGARRELAACASLANELRMPLFQWQVKSFEAMLALLTGDLEEGERQSAEAVEIGQRIRPETAMGIYGAQLFHHRWSTGRLDELISLIRATSERYPWIPAWRSALAVIHSENGRPDEAREQLALLGADDFAGIPRDGNWLLTISLLSLVVRTVNDADRAPILYELLAPYADQCITVGNAAACIGSVQLFLGMLAATAQQWNAAQAHYKGAIESNRRIGARPLVAFTCLELADMHLRSGRPDGRALALQPLNEALSIAQNLGLKAMVEEALALKLEIQGVASVDVTSSIHALSNAVASEQPDLSSLASPDGTVTILFTDIVGSTQMTMRLGDDGAQEVLAIHNWIIRDRLAAFGGYEVKSAGDGFMLVFSSGRRALQFASAVQQAFAERNRQPGNEPIHVRMGLHTGEAIREADDFFGHTVILASRIAAQADGGEVLTSSLLRQLVGNAGFSFDDGTDVELKGLSGPQRVYRLRWDEAPSASLGG